MEPIETLEHNGCTIEIHYDDSCESPRDAVTLGTFLGFDHRNYKIGDETITEDYGTTCSCDYGWVTFPVMGETVERECTLCSGEGTVYLRHAKDPIAFLKAMHGARVVLPVGMLDHSGVHYYVGGGAHWSDSQGWDSGTCGFILDTPAQIEQCMGEAPITDEEIAAGLKGEIEEYDRWARGDCYGYVVTDADGEEIGSCWGFIGLEYAIEQAKEECPTPAGV